MPVFGISRLALRGLERRVEALEDERDDYVRRLKRLEGKLHKGLADLRRDLEADLVLAEEEPEEEPEDERPLNRRT